MKVHLGIKPYTHLWMNCILNTTFSLLCTKDDSYQAASLLNEYGYFIEKEKHYMKYCGHELIMDYNQSFYDFRKQVVKEHIEHYFNENADIIAETKEFVRQKEIFLLCVRLNHWTNPALNNLPDRYRHYTFINGFAEEEKIFYVLDDQCDGFLELTIEESYLKSSLEDLFTWEHAHAFILKLTDTVEPFHFQYERIHENAKKIYSDINSLTVENLFDIDFTDKNYTGFIILALGHITSMAACEERNHMLFHYLADHDYISREKGQRLENAAEELNRHWQIIRSKIRRQQVTPMEKSFSKQISRMTAENLDREAEMWQTLIQPG